MSRRLTPTLLLCLAGAGLVVLCAALGLGAATGPSAAPPPAPTSAAPAPDGAAAGDYGPPVPGGTEPPAAPSLTIEGFSFGAPSSAAPGSVVAIANRDSTDHTVTARDGSFDSGPIGAGQQATIGAPASAGRYEYFCSIHPEMTGTLTVG